jgi:hypothetical protein
LPASALHKFTDFLPAMPHSLPYFYGILRKLKTVEYARRGVAMKDLLKATLVIAGMLALVVIARVAIVARQFNQPMAVKDQAPVAPADRASEITVLAIH